jgi:hypothetical protein
MLLIQSKIMTNVHAKHLQLLHFLGSWRTPRAAPLRRRKTKIQMQESQTSEAPGLALIQHQGRCFSPAASANSSI